MASEEKLDNKKVLDDFYCAYEAKRELIKRQREDFEFRLGKQWEKKDEEEARKRGFLPVTDNRVQANIFLLTGLERQNRSDIRAFPEGAEDGLEAQMATLLIKNAMKISDGDYKVSEIFEDGVTCGESGLELYLDNTYNFLTPKPRWKKNNFDDIFPEPGWKEYDFSDCSYVYKWTRSLKKQDLISIYPEKKKKIEALSEGVISPQVVMPADGEHTQYQDYPKDQITYLEAVRKNKFDLLERYYKKWVERVFVIDRQDQTLTLTELKEGDERTEREVAEQFIQDVIQSDSTQAGRYAIIERMIPEIWVYAVTGGLEEPLVNEKAWFFPRWKGYPFFQYFAHWTSAPLSKEDQHYNIQGVVSGIKSTQLLHNKAETLKLRHLNSSANSGWLTEEDAWVDRTKVEQYGSTPGINLEYKRGRPKPDQIYPMQASGGHELMSRDTTEAMKAQLGINADLLATQQGGTDSGRAIALRQRQGVIMVQKLFDNLSWTKKIMGRFLLSQLSELYDTETAKKVIGSAFIAQNFTIQGMDEMGQPTNEIDEKRLNDTIRKILSDSEIGIYDIAIGESISTETKRIAEFQEIQQFAQQYPGLISPDIVIEASQLPQSVKNKVLANIKQQQAMMANLPPTVPAGPSKKPPVPGGRQPQLGG